MTMTLRQSGADKAMTDISHLSEHERRTFIEREAAHAPQTVYLLTADARKKAANVALGVFDLDDCVTGSGEHTIPEHVLSLLRQGRHDGQARLALSGRHQALIDPLFHNHDGDPGFGRIYTELGAYAVTAPGRREYFLATQEDERSLETVIRERIQRLKAPLEKMYGVVLAPNLGGAHSSLDSHSVLHNGTELTDDAILHCIMSDIRNALIDAWEVRPSSRDTFDIVRKGITKSNAMRRILEEHDVLPEHAGYTDDSPNGADVHRDYPSMFRAVVYGRKTDPKMLLNADVVTAGTANVAPLLRFMNKARQHG